MKNEDKIVELLAESLKRQDQMIEQMSGINERMDKHENALNTLIKSVNTLTDIVKVAMEELKEIAKIKERLDRIERHTGLS